MNKVILMGRLIADGLLMMREAINMLIEANRS